MSKAFAFVLLVWVAWILNCVLFSIDLNQLGIRPRSISGLTGIVFMPFLHGNFWHIFNNSLGLIALLSMLFVSHRFARAESVLLQLIILSGVFVWLIGRSGTPNHPVLHIGASGLVYALASYSIIVGFVHKHFLLMVTSCIVMIQCGAGLLSGLMPTNGPISWEGHLAGVLAGILVGCYTEKKQLRTSLVQK